MNHPQCHGLRSLYQAAKLRQLRAIAGDPNSTPKRVTEATDELRKLADSLYQDREAGPTALIARLERDGIAAVERTLAGRTDAPAAPQVGCAYELRFPAKPDLGVIRVRVIHVLNGSDDPAVPFRHRRKARVELLYGQFPKYDGSEILRPPECFSLLITDAEWTPVSEVHWRTRDALLSACKAAVAATRDESDPANLPPDVLDQMEWAIAEAMKGGAT